MFEALKSRGFHVLALHHAEATLEHDMADAVRELQAVLLEARIPADELIRGGGGEGEFTQRLRRALADVYGWRKHVFEIKKIVHGEEREFISHEIDHVKRFAPPMGSAQPLGSPNPSSSLAHWRRPPPEGFLSV